MRTVSMTTPDTDAIDDASLNGNVVDDETDHDDENTVLADERTPSTPTAGSPSVRAGVGLTKVDGRWLVSSFDPT
jgi:hypothetical protein